MPKLLTVEEVAQIFHVKIETIYTWKCLGKITGIKINGRLLFDESYICSLIGASI